MSKIAYKVEEVETPWGVDRVFYAKDAPASGRLYTSREPKGEMRAQACAAPDAQLSKIAAGFDTGQAGLMKGDARLLVNAIYISYLRRMSAACEDEWEKTVLQIQVNQVARSEPARGVTYAQLFDGYYEDLVEKCFRGLFRKRGARGVEKLAQLIKTVESKSRELEKDEEDFLRGVSIASMASKDVSSPPLQKDAREAWLELDVNDRNDGKWYKLRDRLGFNWLPTAPGRGKALRNRGK